MSRGGMPLKDSNNVDLSYAHYEHTLKTLHESMRLDACEKNDLIKKLLLSTETGLVYDPQQKSLELRDKRGRVYHKVIMGRATLWEKVNVPFNSGWLNQQI